MRHILLAMGLSLTALLLTGCGASKSPDDTVRDLLRDVTSGRAGAIWRALPENYQGDVQQALGMLAGKLDPELYDEGFAMVREFLTIAREKPGMMADLAPQRLAMIDMDKHADMIFEMFEDLMSGQIATVDGVRDLDVGKFLDTTGAALFGAISTMAEEKGQDLDDALSNVKIQVQDLDGDNCVLLLGSSKMPMNFPVPFQRVGGKWIPTALVAAWPGTMTKIRNGIREMPSMSDPATKKRMRTKLDRAKKQLAAARKAKTKEELREAMQRMARPPK
jgi:hypothetical protein